MSSSYFDGEWNRRPPSLSRRSDFAGLLQADARLCLFDLGAAGGTPPPFLFSGDTIDVVNFEPDARAADSIDSRQLNIPVAVGPEHLTEIHLNRRPTTSSLLPANRKITDRYDWSQIFGHDDDIFETVSKAEIETQPLDRIVSDHNVPQPDFLKIDVQGLSLEVLEGSVETIDRSVLGIEIEVEFLESYLGQRTFGAIHEFLYAKGFEIFRLKNLNAWYFKTSLPVRNYSGQDTFCDLVYFRSIDSISEHPDFWTSEKAVRILLLMLLYDLTDAAAAYFEALTPVIEESERAGLRELITNWPGALDYFYDPCPESAAEAASPSRHEEIGIRDHVRSAMAISPLHVYRYIKSLFGRKG